MSRKGRSIYTDIRGSAKPHQGLLVNIRGPIGSGKSTLARGLENRPPWRFWYLDVDAALSQHPADLHGTFMKFEGPLEVDILGLHAKLALGRGLHLLLDQNFQTSAPLDRFLGLIGRSRHDPNVILFRLTVDREEAVRRKTTVRPSYVRASHKGFRLYRIPGEIVIETTGRTRGQVLQFVRRALKDRVGERAS